jgi:hypothetical protein
MPANDCKCSPAAIHVESKTAKQAAKVRLDLMRSILLALLAVPAFAAEPVVFAAALTDSGPNFVTHGSSALGMLTRMSPD